MAPGEKPVAQDAYNELAATYTQEIETSSYNADFEFPATRALIPDVTGKRILDAGCGSGLYTEWLLDQGADVVGIDANTEMLKQATERVDDQAEFHQANLEQSLDFAVDGGFDGVVSGLVLGYVRNWQQTFSEFARLLCSGGFVVFSVSHPLDDYLRHEDSNYFDIELQHRDWEVEVPYYRRPFSEIITPVLEAGLQIETITEPQPTEAFKEKCPEVYEKESTQPVFHCLRAVKP